MFCSKCGKEIHDEAVVCVHCGCSVGGKSVKPSHQHSADYSKLKAFQDDVKTIHTLGLVSLILCLGIGIIFQIINIIKINKYINKKTKKLEFPKFDLKGSYETAEYESAIRKFKQGRIMTLIGYAISASLLFFLFMFLLAGLTH